MVNIFENQLGIKGLNDLKQLSTCYVKFFKITFQKIMLKAFAMFHWKNIQLGWTFKVTQHCVSPTHIPPNYHFKLMK